ncbi:hypothetical protein LIER_33732 [Lithospermum erythrorhizon]|uniref:Uncharacterized protein n=1 Tax=Lithospermum erythrorhizon TaxID=34254 RepID=A0AAV3RYE9_LITER
MKPPCKKPEPKKPAAAPPPNPTPAKPPNPTPAPPPPGPLQGPLQGPHAPPHLGHYMEDFENFPGDPRFGFREHSRTWKLGFHPNHPDNYSYQDYHQGHIPALQEYYHGNLGMNFNGNYKQIDYYPDGSMGALYYPDDQHCNCHSYPGHGTTFHGRSRGIGAPPPRLTLPPPDRYMDHYDDHDHHHGYGQSLCRGNYYAGNHLPPWEREFELVPPPLDPYRYPRGPPTLLGAPSLDPYHCPGTPPHGVRQYYLPSNYGGNYFSDENPNACSIM